MDDESYILSIYDKGSSLNSLLGKKEVLHQLIINRDKPEYDAIKYKEFLDGLTPVLLDSL